MTNVKVQWTFGQFKVSAEADIDVSEPVGTVGRLVLEAGLLQILQRVPSSRAEKALAGYEKRPEKFQRGSIPWSDENALKLVDAFGTEVEVGEGVKLGFKITDVQQHVPGAGVSAVAQATEMAKTVRTNPAMMAALGAKSDIEEAELVTLCNTFLGQFRVKKA